MPGELNIPDIPPRPPRLPKPGVVLEEVEEEEEEEDDVVEVVVVVEDVLDAAVVDAEEDRGAQGLGKGALFSRPACVLSAGNTKSNENRFFHRHKRS